MDVKYMRRKDNYRILYEDRDLLVIWKPAGLAVQSARPTVPDVMSLLKQAAMEKGEDPRRLHLVNRLDQPVEGIFLAAKNEKSAAELNRQLGDKDRMQKCYRALVCGRMPHTEGTLVDYLLKDSRMNMSRVTDAGTKGSKRCELCYRVLREWERRSLLEIKLLTGRHHQIRVQLAHAGAPVAGDGKYGKAEPGQLCLCSYKTEFVHPRTGELMSFQEEPTFPVPPTARG